MMAVLKFIILAAGLLALGLSEINAKKWWDTASIYQIYPRSFKDSDGDGVGDIKGITQQLDYLKEIGIDMAWLSPIFTSPMADFGYDISNFTEIDPIFGTMADFEELLVKAEAVGINVILDFVPNHSSDECEWFKKSAAGDAEYKDFYVWHAGHMENGVRKPPNNWISVFRQSMWTWNEQRQAYYMHQFHAKQPDFNYRNPKVRETMNEVLRFWLRKGVAGYRMDAVAHIYEIAPDASGNWPDEPRNPWVDDPEDYMSLDHIYTVNQQETFDLLFEFRELMDEMSITLGGGERIIMSEAYSPIDLLMKYYGNETTKGVQMPFNFEFISHLSHDSNAHQYMQLINGWLSNMPKGRTANWVLGNHDCSRVGSRMGKERIDLFNIILFTLPGVSVTYMGEEIGMTDVWISWNDTVDPQACQSNTDNYERLTRDPNRTPFQWNAKNFAGFTEGKTAWLPIANDYKLVNVERQRLIERSHLNIFKQLQELKKAEQVMQSGSVEVKTLNSNVLAIKRSLKGKRSYIVLLNIMDDVESVNLHAAFTGLSKKVEYVVVTADSVRRKSDKVYAESVLLLPKEAVILRTTS